VGSERLGRKYSAVWCSEWGRDGRRRAGAGCLWWLSEGEHSGVQGGTGAVKRWRRKKWGAPFIAARGGGTKVARRWNHGWETAVVATVGTSSARSRRRHPDSEADERTPRDF
jgi:hypothetical protein